ACRRAARHRVAPRPRLRRPTAERSRRDLDRLRGQDEARRFGEVGATRLGRPDRRELPFGLVADVEQDRAAAGAMTGLDVVEDVADHPAAGQVEAMRARGLAQQTRRRLAAEAADPAARAGRVRAAVDGGDVDAALVADATAE